MLLAEWTGLEPATPCVTGMYSNQLNYHSVWDGKYSHLFSLYKLFFKKLGKTCIRPKVWPQICISLKHLPGKFVRLSIKTFNHMKAYKENDSVIYTDEK